MKIIKLIASGLLGLAFITFGLNFFLKFMDTGGGPPPDSLGAQFMGALVGSGVLAVVKLFQITGGILVAIPKTRNFGLLILGPIIIVILFYNTMIAPGGWSKPPVLVITSLALFLLLAEWRKFKQLLY
ncbi:MAG: hypothetical protein AAGH40_01380 [Verrucomicrobiota bacterium]